MPRTQAPVGGPSAICIFLLLSGLVLFHTAAAQSQSCAVDRYVFSWSLDAPCALEPRGGISTGIPVTLSRQPSAAWQALQASDLAKFERDRRAILALAGDYRVNFEFIETVGYTLDYERPAPYQSWATERVYVIADTGNFISLQHVMVMYYRVRDDDTDGMSVRGPVVMKHWRQDWRYDDTNLFVFSGNREWTHQSVTPQAAHGRWTQAVYQVDDAPRYEASGRWRVPGPGGRCRAVSRACATITTCSSA